MRLILPFLGWTAAALMVGLALYARGGPNLAISVGVFTLLLYCIFYLPSRFGPDETPESQADKSARPDALEDSRPDTWEQAYLHAAGRGRAGRFGEVIERQLDLPSPSLRAPILELYRELHQLESSMESLPAPETLEADFRVELKSQTQEAFKILWGLCDQLAGVASQKVGFPEEHPTVVALQSKLEGLTETARKMRVRLAEHVMSKLPATLEEAEISLRVLGRQADDLRSLDLES